MFASNANWTIYQREFALVIDNGLVSLSIIVSTDRSVRDCPISVALQLRHTPQSVERTPRAGSLPGQPSGLFAANAAISRLDKSIDFGETKEANVLLNIFNSKDRH